MINLLSFKDEIEHSLSLPITYDHWKVGQVPSLPYLAYNATGSEDMYADDSNYSKFTEVRLEFYSSTKDFVNETRIEDFLTGNGIVYSSTDSEYIKEEKMFETIYEFDMRRN